jgi:hypothetical protein
MRAYNEIQDLTEQGPDEVLVWVTSSRDAYVLPYSTQTHITVSLAGAVQITTEGVREKIYSRVVVY